jgi:hypothetical protein
MLPGQLNLFEPTTVQSTSVRGLLVTLPGTCLCGERASVIGSSAGPHWARVVCSPCGRFRYWMSAESFGFVASVIDHFGRPTDPIIVSNPKSGG